MLILATHDKHRGVKKPLKSKRTSNSITSQKLEKIEKINDIPPEKPIEIPDILNIDLSLDDFQMDIRGLPKIGNKLEDDSDDPEFVRSDFEEYRGLGQPSIDSTTMQVEISDLEQK